MSSSVLRFPNTFSFEQKMQLFNDEFPGFNQADPAHPLLSITQIGRAITATAQRNGIATAAMRSFYPPKEARIDMNRTSEMLDFLDDLLAQCVNQEMTRIMKGTNLLSERTFSAALSGAFTKDVP
jgi:hypothetical protein